MNPTLIRLRILLPFRIFAERDDVRRMVVETSEGSFGILPRRLDCVAPLVPAILMYESESEGEVFVAIDEGVMVKTGTEVVVSVRNAIGGTDLGSLRDAVEQEFLHLDEREKNVRTVLSKLESGLVHRFLELHRE